MHDPVCHDAQTPALAYNGVPPAIVEYEVALHLPTMNVLVLPYKIGS